MQISTLLSFIEVITRLHPPKHQDQHADVSHAQYLTMLCSCRKIHF